MFITCPIKGEQPLKYPPKGNVYITSIGKMWFSCVDWKELQKDRCCLKFLDAVWKEALHASKDQWLMLNIVAERSAQQLWIPTMIRVCTSPEAAP